MVTVLFKCIFCAGIEVISQESNITNICTVMKLPQKQVLATVLGNRHVLYETDSQHPLQLHRKFWVKGHVLHYKLGEIGNLTI